MSATKHDKCLRIRQVLLWRTTWAYPFGGRYSQAVLLGVEATDSADLGDEVDVLLVLRLLTLASLVFSVEVEEAARQDEVPAGVRRPAGRARGKLLPGAKERDDYKSAVCLLLMWDCESVQTGNNNPLLEIIIWSHIRGKWSSQTEAQQRHQVVALENTHIQDQTHTHVFTHPPSAHNVIPNWRDQLALEVLSEIVSADDSPGCYNGDPRCELVWVVPNQPVRTRE